MVDERFLAHRYKATRLATMVGVVLIFAFFTYALVKTREIRWDLFIVLCAMAAAKVIAMAYYKKMN
jgi:multisubunit Na+/H+ antiporter MnhG subunit